MLLANCSIIPNQPDGDIIIQDLLEFDLESASQHLKEIDSNPIELAEWVDFKESQGQSLQDIDRVLMASLSECFYLSDI